MHLAFQQICEFAVVAAAGIADAAVVDCTLDNVEHVAALVAVAAANIDSAGIRLAVELFSANIGRLFDSVSLIAVVGRQRLMCSLKVKVAPNR